MQRSRTGEIEVTVFDVSDWTGLSAALYVAKDSDETVVFVLEGTIDEETNKITFSYKTTDTVLLVENRYLYEVVLYNDARTVVQTTTSGVVFVEPILQVTP